jgi:hypothetical protein
MNKIWSVLSRGVVDSTYGRRTADVSTPSQYFSKTIHDILVPSTERGFSCLCTEQILQAILASSLRDMALSTDTENTYEYPVDFPVAFQSSVTGSPSGVGIHILDESRKGRPWTTKSFSLAVDPVALTVAVRSGSKTRVLDYSFSDNLSSKMYLDPGLVLRMSGSLPVTPFTFFISCISPFRRTIVDLAASLSELYIPWAKEDYQNIYESTKNPVEKIAAAAMAVYEELQS